MFESPFGFNPSQSFTPGFKPSNSMLPKSSIPKGTISQSSDYSNWQDTGIVPVSKNTIQSMTRPNYVQSKKYPQATVEQEQFIDQQAGGDKYKAMEEYDKFLQTKKSKEFLDMRKEQVTNLMEEKVNTKDESKRKQINTLIKGSMLADFAREQALKSGVLDVYSKSDNDIYAGLIKQPEHEQAFADYLNGDKSLEDVVNVLTPGYGVKKDEQPVQEEKGFLAQTGEDIKTRLGNVVDLIGNVSGQDVEKAGGVTNYVNQKLLRIGGQVAGGVNDVVGNAFQSLMQTVGADKPLGEALNKVLDTDIGKKGIELYQQGAEQFAQFEAAHPETAQSIKDVVAIAQAIPLAKGVSSVVQSGKKAIKSIPKVIGTSKKGASKQAITDIISAPETKSNIQQALKQSRIEETPVGRVKRFLLGEKGATIQPTEQIKKATDIIVKNIEKPATTESGLYKQIQDVIVNKSTALKSKLQSIKIPKSTTKNTATIELKRAVKELATLKDEFLESDIKGIEAGYKKLLNAGNLDDVWEARIKWDDLFSDAVKRANDMSSPSTRKAHKLWKKTRDIMNKYIDDTAKNIGDDTIRSEFEEMSALFQANSNIYEGIGKEILKPTEGVINVKNALKAGAGVAGVGLYNKLTQ